MKEYLRDYLKDTIVLNLRTAGTPNDLGEPTYTETHVDIPCHLMSYDSQKWGEMGLDASVRLVAICDYQAEIPDGSTITAGGVTYRDFTITKGRTLFGAGHVRIELREAA